MKKSKKGKKLLLSTAIACCLGTSIMFAGCGDELKLTSADSVVKPGEIIDIDAKLGSKVIDDSDITYEIKEGAATLDDNGNIVVNEDAVPGSKIKVKCTYGDYSEEIEITVGEILIEDISLATVGNATVVEVGGNIQLVTTLQPLDATLPRGGVTYTLNEGAPARIVGDTLIVNNDAIIGTEIVVTAHVGTFTDTYTITIVNKSEGYNIIAGNATIETAKNGSVDITPLLMSRTGGTDTNAVFGFQLSNDNVSVATTDNKIFTVTSNKAGITTITFSCTNRAGITSVSSIITSVVAPSAIQVPGYLNYFTNAIAGADKVYTIGKNQAIPFALDYFLQGRSSSTCSEDVVVTCLKNGNPSTNFVYNSVDKTILFTEEGKYDLTITSNHPYEYGETNSYASTTYSFEVNNLQNISTYEELKEKLEARKSVNIVAYNESKPGEYNLVPAFISQLKDNTSLEIANSNTDLVRREQIDCLLTQTNNSITINGNMHNIDVSSFDYSKCAGTSADRNNIGALLYINPILSEGEQILPSDTEMANQVVTNSINPGDAASDTTKYFVNIKDFGLIGSLSVNASDALPYADSKLGYIKSYYSRGIQIGSNRNKKYLYTNFDNVSVTGFNIGIRISSAKSDTEHTSVLSNMTVENNFKAGFEICASQLTIKDSQFGLNGQGAFELTTDSCAYSGNNFNEFQKLTLDNVTLKESAICNYSTTFFDAYAPSLGAPSIMGYFAGEVSKSGDDLLKLIIPNYSETNTNEWGIGYFALVTHPVNKSTVLSVDADDIIDATDNAQKTTFVDALTNANSEDATIKAQGMETLTTLAGKKYVKVSIGPAGYLYLQNMLASNLPAAE